MLKRFLTLSPDETTFAKRGFPGLHAAARPRLESVGRRFVEGYNAALSADGNDALVRLLETGESETRGFAFEGAAMALTLLDRLVPWGSHRVSAFLQGPGEPHTYMVHVGVGWALARLRCKVAPVLRRMDPLLGWLIVDGYGFHEGYFHWRRTFCDHARPAQFDDTAARVFDQGAGRSLWFVHGGEVDPIKRVIDSFHPERRPDLWSGIGLACAYAGGVDPVTIEQLESAAGDHVFDVAQGAAFAAKARQRAGIPAEHTDVASSILCRLPSGLAADLTDAALDPQAGEDALSYESWRRSIRERLRLIGVCNA